MLPSVLHPVCMSKNYRCRKETKKKQAEHESHSAKQSQTKVLGYAFKNRPLEHQDSLKCGVMSSHSVFMYIYFANSFVKLGIPVATCCLNKTENIHIRVLGTVKVSLQPGPGQGWVWFSRFSCKSGWPQQLYTQDKDWKGHTRDRHENLGFC